MTPERWQRIEELFHAAREHAPQDRDAFLAAQCDGDAALRLDILSLLQQQDGTLLRGDVADAAALVLACAPGSRNGQALGVYVLGPLLGAGGMGEVYRARDTRLGRDVAVKILPPTLGHYPDRLVRFEREARILAALNHPNIAAIYGLEESGGLRALVLELVEGITLAEKIRANGNADHEGPTRALPVGEALAIARQIAEALETAHHKGIVHRDLKPANIKITPSGIVKVLDFGLAKIQAPDPGGPAAVPVLATVEGAVLGTVAYMSPEQARGLPVDKRTDIWAFGCVLYEMLTGRRSFPGQTSADVLGAITSAEPDWTLLPHDTPVRVRDVLRRCLTKDPDRRLHDLADARIDIEEAIADPRAAAPAESPPAGSPIFLRNAAWVLTGVVVASMAIATWFAMSTTTARRSLARVAIELPPNVALALGRGSSVAVSPDEQHIVYAATSGGRTQLYVRALDGLESTPIAGTDGGANPFFSPDGRWIGFWANGTLRKVPVQGGAVLTIAAEVSYLGAAWGREGTIVFEPTPPNGLWRVPASGGTPQRVTTRREGALYHSWPQFLPRGNALLYTIWNNTGFDGGRIAVQSLEGGEPTILVERASYGHVVTRDGRRAYLVYAKPEGLLAAPFDLEQLRLTGPSMAVLPGVQTNLSGGAQYSVSPGGLLAYVPGEMDERDKTLLWVDHDGTATEIAPLPGIGFQYRLSPDGRRLVGPNAAGPNRDLWIHDLKNRGASIRLTFDAVTNSPIWTPDGERIIYTSGAPNGNLFWRAADGSGDEKRLTTSANMQNAGSVSPDGHTLAYAELDPTRGFDIWLLPLDGSHRPRVFLSTPRNEGNPRISPDGRWLAYQSNVSGNVEVSVASFPDAGRRRAISTGGGYAPLWSPNGHELYYRTAHPDQGGGRMMAVSIDTTGAEPTIGTPRVLFSEPYQANGDIAPDGRFLLLRPTPKESPARVIQLVLNWFDDLQAKVPLP